ncbi:MAG: hypothetical protein B5M53_07090 [Candidatus Cloacimonas sp. 4484_209]|nr:MAG: hypothetical protein B5M53_07090 [Candidatus Cloacimonas sp. 4484_209]
MMFIMRRRNGFTILLRSGKALTLLLIIFGWYFIIQAMRTPLPIVGILGIRENYRFLLLFPLIIALSQEYESFPKAAFKWMVLGGISISILHLLFYITHWEPPLLYDKATILIPGAHRIILEFEGTKMLSLVGGGPSGLPATVVPLACASIACAFYKKEKRIAWVLAAAIIFLTSFLTLSGTWIVATAFGLVCMLVLQKYCLLDRKGAQGRFFILKICGLILVFVFLFGRTILRPEGPVSLFYLSKYYITTSTDWFGRLPTKSLIDLFFGQELATGGGAPLLAGKTYISTSIGLVDMGWMSIVYQVGILGFSIIFIW